MSAIIEALNNAIQAGIAHDWVTMGTNIASALASGVDFVLGFLK